MSFQRRLWYRIAVIVVAINVAGGIFAYLTDESIHAFVHGAFAVGFGIWAMNLRQSSGRGEQQIDPRQDKVEMLEAGMSQLESELRETQARLEFADQLLKKKPPSN